MKTGKVLLITGPAGSGKTTLAQKVGQLPGWKLISEDDFWAAHNRDGLRTEEQEAFVQKEVVDTITPLLADGTNVVLEFILYKQPPNPLTNYLEVLKSKDIKVDVVALTTNVETIIRRMHTRGREEDLSNIEDRKQFAANQISCLQHSSVDPNWVIDTTGTSASDVFDTVLQRIK